jgi:aspartyl-tRNA synthetase
MHYRDCLCGALRPSDIGRDVTLSGWVASRRDHGGVIFIDLRDRDGITQIVFRPELHAEAASAAHSLRSEDVITVVGKVAARLEGTENPKLVTGGVEVVVSSLTVLNRSEVPPFPMDERIAHEDLRLTHRFLDLRRPAMAQNLRLRHRVTKTIRDVLDTEGFWEIETPILSKSTPEGARDFLVPSRMTPGSFYALPQAPQQYKQMLMVGGVDKYFQIARCFRDEDLRADRQPEFTQVDIEASFVKPDDLFKLIETMFQRVFRETRGVEIPVPFQRMTHSEAMNRFGSDKPDTRFGMELQDVGDIFAQSQFKVFRAALDAGGVVKAINAKGFACITTGQIEELTELAKGAGAKGLAFIKVENGEWKSPIVKFFTDAEKAALSERLGMEEGDLVLFGANNWETSCVVLGRVRLHVAALQKLAIDPDLLNFLWVVDFPLLHHSVEEQRWHAVHHPFTRPKAEDRDLLKDPAKFSQIRAEAYDIVLNGVEIGGGSIRIHEGDLQSEMFSVLGIGHEEQEHLFGHILRAFRHGAPPHGGLALGLDRLVALIAREESIREVIAFPKNNRGMELMTGSPATVDPKQIRELYISSTVKPKVAGTAAPVTLAA